MDPNDTARASRTLVADARGWGAWRRAGLVLLVLSVSSIVCALLAPHLDTTNLALVYLAGVVYIALRLGRRAAVATVLGGIFVFDLIYVEPRWSLHPIDPQFFFTFAVMLVVGWIVAHLAGQAGLQTQAAEARARRAAALSRMAARLAPARSDAAVSEALSSSVHEALGVSLRLRPTPEGGKLDVEPPPLASADDRELLAAMVNQASVALERAHLEQRSARAALEVETERVRNTLLAGLSHDFRTPLTTIIGSVTSLLDQGHAIGEDGRRVLLAGVLGEARRLQALTSDLLDLTRMAEGAVRPVAEWCPADELIDEARAALGNRLDQHRLDVRVADDAVVWCDPRLIGQALVNLLDNAARHTPPGGRIGVAIGVSGARWQLVVHDDGPGLPPGQEQQIFRKFHRGDAGADGAGDGGTGLGLAICAVVAQLHGGTIRARNEAGACLEMDLPQPENPGPGDEPEDVA